MSNARNFSSTADDQARQLSMRSSSSTSTMTSFLSSHPATESKEEKEANGREEKHNPSDGQHVNNEMPGPLHNIILDYLAYAKLRTITAGSASLFHSIKKAKTKALITAIVSGDLITVEAMIDEDQSLLLERLEEKDSITSPSAQKSNNVTPYRTALAVEDNQIADFIKNKMILQKAGDLANQQYREQFPENWEEEEKQKWAPAFTQLTTLTLVIKDAKTGDITSTGRPRYLSGVRKGSDVAIALAEFRKQLDALLNDVAITGRHCNPNLLLEAYRIYEQHYTDHFGNNPSDPRALLFWQQVIGTIQCGLPVNYVQAFCDGLYQSEVKLRRNAPQGRSLTFNVHDISGNFSVPHNIYPLADSRLGFEWAASNYIAYTVASHKASAAGCVRLISKLMSIKNSGRAVTHAPARRHRTCNISPNMCK